jgi:hypothetical protein
LQFISLQFIACYSNLKASLVTPEEAMAAIEPVRSRPATFTFLGKTEVQPTASPVARSIASQVSA